MDLVKSCTFVGLEGKSPTFDQVYPGNGVHCPVYLFIGRYVVNDLNPLQVLVVIDLVPDDVMIRHELEQVLLDLHFQCELLVHVAGEELAQIEEVMPINFLKYLDGEHVLTALDLVPQGLQHVGHPDVGLPGRDLRE